jgi:hypothetical protein
LPSNVAITTDFV